MGKTRPLTGDSLVRNLRHLMDLFGFTQAELARRSGVSQRHISGVLSGENGCTVEAAAQLAAPFGLNGWQLPLPNLPRDLAQTKSLNRLLQAYINASPEGREFLIRAAEREEAQAHKVNGK